MPWDDPYEAPELGLGIGLSEFEFEETSGRGCTGDFSKKKMVSNTFFSQCKLVVMVCRMISHQGRFQKSHFLAFYVRFLVFFSCFARKNAFLDGFLVIFTVVWPLVWL